MLGRSCAADILTPAQGWGVAGAGAWSVRTNEQLIAGEVAWRPFFVLSRSVVSIGTYWQGSREVFGPGGRKKEKGTRASPIDRQLSGATSSFWEIGLLPFFAPQGLTPRGYGLVRLRRLGDRVWRPRDVLFQVPAGRRDALFQSTAGRRDVLIFADVKIGAVPLFLPRPCGLRRSGKVPIVLLCEFFRIFQEF
jgi:hypothetical protein